MHLINPLSLLTEEERDYLTIRYNVDIGQFYLDRPTKLCDFIIDLDFTPLAVLIDTANYGNRVYELMSIKRPGDLIFYIYVYFINIEDKVLQHLNRYATFNAFTCAEGLSLYECDQRFNGYNDESESFEKIWCHHRKKNYWNALLEKLLTLVKAVQFRIRDIDDDYLIQHEINLLDKFKHRLDYVATIPRPISFSTGIKNSEDQNIIELIAELIKSDKVNSVSCPLKDFVLWRLLVEEQIRRSKNSSKQLQQAFYLSTDDIGFRNIEFENWGGYVHIPYEGCTGGDLFIYPSWRRLNTLHEGKHVTFKSVTTGKPCHYLLLENDYGEIEGANRTIFGKWVLYESKSPYTPSINIDEF